MNTEQIVTEQLIDLINKYLDEDLKEIISTVKVDDPVKMYLKDSV